MRRPSASPFLMPRMNPENVDLAELARSIRTDCGPVVDGAVVGRTRMRDAVVRNLECSQLEAEQLVDTLIGRGFVSRRDAVDGRMEWLVNGAD